MHALIVDDSRAIRGILRGILRQAGFEVIEAENGRAALDLLTGVDVPDVALVDWNMPEMDGVSFVRAVRADPRYASLRLIMVTTENEHGKLSDALNAGADEYVMKPFTKDVIFDKLEMLGIGVPNHF